MREDHLNIIANELAVGAHQVAATAKLIEEGATVPFIARYRKEATGSLDEVAVTSIRDRLFQLEELDKRREAILKSLEERGLLSDELKQKIAGAATMTTLEDIYLPFKPKRRTRATVAREKGLEPLALEVFDQDEQMDPAAAALAFVDPEKGVASVEEALAGARDIIAEWVNENQEAREALRALYSREGLFAVKSIPEKEAEGAKYSDYFDWEEPIATAPSHRILAVRRGAKEGFLDLRVTVQEDRAMGLLEGLFIKGKGPASAQVEEALRDGFQRLLSVGMETEMRLETKKRADDTAIRVFAENLRELLMAPPLGQKSVLAVDPGIRTGCKLACLDPQGKLLRTETVYLFQSEKEKLRAAQLLKELCAAHRIEAVAVGNGTAGRETEAFIRGLEPPGNPQVVMVNESGASVYSASETARQEFPDLDLTFRGAVSIGRRLMDPLAELVKIEPKSIGVGQYQHDVNQPALKRSLDDVVVSCVNAVGVEVNTASEQLLSYVSGLGPQLAKNLIAFRNERGPLSARDELKDVPRMGPKAFEQAAGFLRIRGGKNPLDASAVHPESYGVVEAMAQGRGCSIQDLMESREIRESIDLAAHVTPKVGLPTLTDIMAELAKPGRDPRARFERMEFAEGIHDLADLRKGMKLPGVVTNVTAFGAFVDIGVHQDGLVHVSELADRFVKDPAEVVKVNQRVNVTVLDVDAERKRISLSMKKEPGQQRKAETGRTKPRPVEKGKRPPEKKQNQPFNNPFIRALKK